MECNFKIDEPCVHLMKGDHDNFCARPTAFLCIETLDNERVKLSHSSRSAWTRCRQKYYFSKVVGLRTHDRMLGSPLKIGIVMDDFLKSRYLNYPFKKEFEALCERYALTDVERSKTYALIKAYYDIGINVDQAGHPQYRFTWKTGEADITGVMDCFFGDHFDEVKTSARPDFYLNVHNMTSQLAVYFLHNESIEYATVKVIRVPGLRYNADKESVADYQDRLYSGIISRPSYYFPGFDKLKRTWGKNFYRNEFPLDAIKDDYEKMAVDIQRAAKEDSFYQSWNCYCPGECEFISICKTGGAVSEDIFTYRDKAKEGK